MDRGYARPYFCTPVQHEGRFGFPGNQASPRRHGNQVTFASSRPSMKQSPFPQMAPRAHSTMMDPRQEMYHAGHTMAEAEVVRAKSLAGPHPDELDILEQLIQMGASDEALDLFSAEVEQTPQAFRQPNSCECDTDNFTQAASRRRQPRDLQQEMSRVQSNFSTIKEEEELPDEMQQEVAAAIMHTEEQGYALAGPPRNLYNYLFPIGDAAQCVSVGSVTPAAYQDVVVPMEHVHTNTMEMDLDDVIMEALVVGDAHSRPTDSIFSDTFSASERLPRAKVDKVDSKLEDWVGIAGSSATTLSTRSTHSSESTQPEQTNRDGLEYVLEARPPTHCSAYQLRGSKAPPWFPGYLAMFPEYREGPKLSESPSKVMLQAWESLKPTSFPEESQIVIGGTAA